MPATTNSAESTRLAAAQRRILVAEDDEEMRRLVVDALRRDGFTVETAADGEVLLTRIAQSLDDRALEYDLVVSDVRMPLFTGLDLLDALHVTRAGIPVILMTAFPDDMTRERAQNLGALLFSKPFDVDDLRTAVLHLLEPPAP